MLGNTVYFFTMKKLTWMNRDRLLAERQNEKDIASSLLPGMNSDAITLGQQVSCRGRGIHITSQPFVVPGSATLTWHYAAISAICSDTDFSFGPEQAL
jgi:hypothetical protein